MSFSSQITSVDAICQRAFGEIPITIHPQVPGHADLVIPNAITRNPTLEDDYIPGSAQGTANLILFFNPATLVPPLASNQLIPAKGDTATVNGVNYTLARVKPDDEGGYVLYLRRIS